MSEYWQQIVTGVCMALLAWVGKRLHDRVDRLDRTALTREEFRDALTEMREDRERMHEQNQDTLNRIHERVDDLWSREG